MQNNSVIKKEDNREIILETKIINEKVAIINKYFKGKFLGGGAYGKCYEFESENDGFVYAGKIIDKTKFLENTQKNFENIQSETRIQQSLNYSKVVKVKTCFEDKNNVYIVLEFCKNHTLQDLIKQRKEPLSEIEVQNYIFQLIQGLRYLHSKKIIHRDLKPENLFLDDKLELKIGDFGLVTQLNVESERKNTPCGTLPYMAPELINPDENGYSFEVDIWAIGVIMYYLLTKEFPFSGQTKEKMMELILTGYFDFPENIVISEAAKDLIKQLLVKDPKKRPNLSQILYHDFFHNNVFPEFMDLSTLVQRPTIEYIRKFIPDADENGIINKEVTTKNLYKLKIPIISEIKYEYIDSYSLKKFSLLKGYKHWISYLHKSSQFNFYYYILNNGLFGICYDDLKNIVIDNKNQIFYYINVSNEDEEEQKKDKIEKYEIKNCPEHLKEKLNNVLQYNENYKRKYNKSNDENNSKKVNNNSKKSEKEIKNSDNLIYIKNINLKEKGNFFLKLSDDTKQVIFKDKTDILFSDKGDNIVYIDKNKEQTILQVYNILKNSDKKLIHKMKYIRQCSIEEINRKMKIKYKKYHPENELN